MDQQTATADVSVNLPWHHRPIWKVKNMAPIIGRSVQQTFQLIKKKRLDVTQVDGIYVSTPHRLLKSIGAISE
jgi:hypothetical protein